MEWQPIETAPKTGKYLALRGKRFGIGSFDKSLLTPRHWAVDRWGDDFDPTHWIPLPAPQKD